MFVETVYCFVTGVSEVLDFRGKGSVINFNASVLCVIRTFEVVSISILKICLHLF